MGLARRSGAPVRIRLRASFCTASFAAAALIVACCAAELWAPGGATGRRLQSLYPKDAILTEPYTEDPNRWLVILHCIGIGYMLLGLNTVCDVYFTGALEVMVEQWNIKPDVAGATFMAAGGSAPEFSTSLIGSCFVISDVGFSTIVGSAVFNVLFVIGLCGYVAAGDIHLTWWPLFRDCSYYILGLVLLVIFASDELIGLAEAALLFVAYIGYCVLMYYNPRIEALVDSKVRKAKKQVVPSESLPSNSARKVLPVQETESGASTTDASASSGSNVVHLASSPATYGKQDHPDQPIRTHSVGSATTMTTSTAACPRPSQSTVPDTAYTSGNTPKTTDAPSHIGDDSVPEEEKPPWEQGSGGSVEIEEEEDPGLLEWPEGRINQTIWLASLPIYVPVYYLLPQPRAEKHIFVFTFLLSLLWIVGFTFLLVWWTHTLGQVLRIEDNIMNFTLLAMGTSIPDAASSVAVARAGQGDMAISSSIGSNVFDILVGLPIPWMIKIFIEGGKLDYKVRIFSDFLTFYTLLLLAMVFAIVLCIHFLGWKLNKTLGAAMAVLYLIFLAIAITVEIERPEALMI